MTPGLGVASVQRRARLAEIRRGLRDGSLALAEALDAPEVADYAVVDVVRWGFRSRGSSKIERLGRHAVRCEVNLLVRCGAASEYTKAFVVQRVRFDGPRPRVLT